MDGTEHIFFKKIALNGLKIIENLRKPNFLTLFRKKVTKKLAQVDFFT